MLLNEIATVTDISPELDKRKENQELNKRNEERLLKLVARRKDRNPRVKRNYREKDEIGAKRRENMSQADQIKDIARQIRNNPQG